MSLKQRLQDDMKTAMKAQDKKRLEVVRMLLSEFKYAQSAVNAREELDDASALKVVASYHKKLEKSLTDFPEGEAKAAVLAEIKIVEDYLPQRANAADLERAVSEILAATPERNFGPLMKEVMARLGGAADGKAVSAILKQKLSSQGG